MSFSKVQSFFSKYNYEFYVFLLGVVFGATNTLGSTSSNMKETFSYIVISVCWLGLSYFWKEPTFKKLNLLFFALFILCTYGYIRSFESNISFETLVALTSLFMLLSFISIAGLLFQVRLLYYVNVFIVFFFSSTLFIFQMIVGAYIHSELIDVFLQTNISEAMEFLLTFVGYPKLIALALCYILISGAFYFILRKMRIETTVKISRSIGGVFFILLSIFIITTIQARPFAGGIERIFNEIKNSQKKYANLRESVSIRQENVHLYEAQKKEQGELYVLFIGESLAKYNVASYGYRINTSPKLSAEKNAILFTNTYSNHVQTIPALTLALTGANQYNKEDYTEAPSLISLAKNVGFTVAWFSTQSEQGVYDVPVSILARESDTYAFAGALEKKDILLYDRINKYLNSLDMSKNNLIILNAMGSHHDYGRRIKGVTIELPISSPDFYNKKNNETYDKTVKYTDDLLAKILERLEQEKTFKSLVYFSDHGEDVFNKLGHNSSIFTEIMAEIPLIIWTGNDFDAQKKANLIANKEKYFTNDLMFDSMLGILGIETNAKNDAHDISSAKYEDKLEIGLTLHGRRRIKELPTVHARQMLKKYPKLMAQKLSTVGSLEDAKRQHFKNVEFDVFYDKESNKVLIGTENEQTELTLGEFLSHEQGDFEKIQITINNMDDSKQLEILKELDVLDAKYNLKSRVVLETATLSEKNKNLTANGWQLSYTLPATVLEMEKTKSIEDINVYVNELKKQLLAQKIESISIDESLYPFLTKHVLDSLDNTSLNMRTSLSVGSLAFEENYLKKPWLNDKRVDTILVNRVVYF